ncbi:VTC domain-containing protein [Arthrobacter sp. NEB 688]|uniref:VTC domain-containing protein n=1 Tax=Arthrobacter sp. NEB 688 TaxID=904039 RepID=UPI0015634422|nr:VTC domain-containing protein [Arthrobacter sp. NEB 688]QKE85772.1 molecular chaperone [Arthrobacter sp. NEB 688]
MSTATLPRLEGLPAVGLEELVATSGLLTRVDRKYVLTALEAGMLTALAPAGTRVLEIDGHRTLGYTTRYLDTDGLLTQRLAAHGRRRRFKVRSRRYDLTGAAYLEVKTREGERTVKSRLEGVHLEHDRLDCAGAQFVIDALAAAGIDDRTVVDLAPALDIRYDRTTLHLAGDGARVTVDRALRWERPDGQVLERPDLVVVETKGPGRPSSLDRVLWSLGHRPRRMSKYATGLAALDPALPANRWARTLRDHVRP